MLVNESTNSTKNIILLKKNIFFSYYYNIQNNHYTIYINRYIAISLSTLSTIAAAYLFKKYL